MPRPLSREKESLYRPLVKYAVQATAYAYRPYSDFKVGAALLTFDRRIYVGCNIENAGFSQTIHAEECALSSAIADGALSRALEQGLTQFEFIRAIAVYVPNASHPWPCGGCRQTLLEFGGQIDVIGFSNPIPRQLTCIKLSKLVPLHFKPEDVRVHQARRSRRGA